jgi:4-hydroxy-2-oxoheptanedioate aldolase
MRDLRTNPVIGAWNSGRPAISAWSVMPGKLSGEMLALLDFDVVTVDMQHSYFDREEITSTITAINAAGSAAMVRIPWNDDPGLIMGLLDFGLAGIICPYVSSGEECRRFVSACRYPPLGVRNSNLPRASAYHRNAAAYYVAARERELVIAMIESTRGLENLDEIAATPGLDVLQLGPSDLALSRFGFPIPPAEAGRFIEDAHGQLLATARRHGLRAAANAPHAARARELVAMGYDLIYLGADLFDLADHYRTALGQLADVRQPRGAA